MVVLETWFTTNMPKDHVKDREGRMSVYMSIELNHSLCLLEKLELLSREYTVLLLLLSSSVALTTIGMHSHISNSKKKIFSTSASAILDSTANSNGHVFS